MLSSNISGHDDRIAQWQEGADADSNEDAGGIILQLVRICYDSLSYLSPRIDAELFAKRDLRVLRRSQTSLKLWADGHKVWSGELDAILDRSKNLQQTTISILNSLCKVLLNGLNKYLDFDSSDAILVLLRSTLAQTCDRTKWLLSKPGADLSDSDSDSESEGDSANSDDKQRGSGFTWMVKEIKMLVDCLVDLSGAIEKPAIDPEGVDEPTVLEVEQRDAHGYHTDLIKAKFPKAEAELINCLGLTSWNRYQQLRQERENVANAPVNVADAKSQAASSRFRDSGLGSSLPSAPPTQRAETVISFLTSLAGGKRVKIPPLSAEAKNGAKFACCACNREIRAQNEAAWRQHLYHDLQPYTCFQTDCHFNTVPFGNRKQWSSHLELDHAFGPDWSNMPCPLCHKDTGQGKNAVLAHLSRHMEDIALIALPKDVESEDESDKTCQLSDGLAYSFSECSTNKNNSSNAEMLATASPHQQAQRKPSSTKNFNEGVAQVEDPNEVSLPPAEQWRAEANDGTNSVFDESRPRARPTRSSGTNAVQPIFRLHKRIYFLEENNVYIEVEICGIRYSSDSNEWEYQLKERETGPLVNNGAWFKETQISSSYKGEKTQPNVQNHDKLTLEDDILDYLNMFDNNGQEIHKLRKIPGDISTIGSVHTSRQNSQAPEQDPSTSSNDVNSLNEPALAPGSRRMTKVPNARQLHTSGMDLNDQEDSDPKGKKSLARAQLMNDASRPSSPEAYTIKCYCGVSEDDGQTVLCESCNTWQHIACYYGSANEVPHVHKCTECEPRQIRTAERPVAKGKPLAPKVEQVEYTRTGRVSKARKGLKIHHCECGRSYTRAEHLRRHQKNHVMGEDSMKCGFPDCGQTFTRLDSLRRHEQRHRAAGHPLGTHNTPEAPSSDEIVPPRLPPLGHISWPPKQASANKEPPSPSDGIWPVHSFFDDGITRSRSKVSQRSYNPRSPGPSRPSESRYRHEPASQSAYYDTSFSSEEELMKRLHSQQTDSVAHELLRQLERGRRPADVPNVQSTTSTNTNPLLTSDNVKSNAMNYTLRGTDAILNHSVMIQQHYHDPRQEVDAGEPTPSTHVEKLTAAEALAETEPVGRKLRSSTSTKKISGSRAVWETEPIPKSTSRTNALGSEKMHNFPQFPWDAIPDNVRDVVRVEVGSDTFTQFVTVNHVDDFKGKNVMTKVRKKAMEHHLKEQSKKEDAQDASQRQIAPEARVHSLIDAIKHRTTEPTRIVDGDPHGPEHSTTNADKTTTKVYRGVISAMLKQRDKPKTHDNERSQTAEGDQDSFFQQDTSGTRPSRSTRARGISIPEPSDPETPSPLIETDFGLDPFRDTGRSFAHSTMESSFSQHQSESPPLRRTPRRRPPRPFSNRHLTDLR